MKVHIVEAFPLYGRSRVKDDFQMRSMLTPCSLVTDQYKKKNNLYLRQMGPFIGKKLPGRQRERAQTSIKKTINWGNITRKAVRYLIANCHAQIETSFHTYHISQPSQANTPELAVRFCTLPRIIIVLIITECQN